MEIPIYDKYDHVIYDMSNQPFGSCHKIPILQKGDMAF